MEGAGGGAARLRRLARGRLAALSQLTCVAAQPAAAGSGPPIRAHPLPPSSPITPCLQRESFLTYLPNHSNGVAFIMLVSSINAVCYNMVRASWTGCWCWREGRRRCGALRAAALRLHCCCSSHLLPAAKPTTTPPTRVPPTKQIHSLMIKKTSAGDDHGCWAIVGLLLLSAMLLGEGREFTAKMTLG